MNPAFIVESRLATENSKHKTYNLEPPRDCKVNQRIVKRSVAFLSGVPQFQAVLPVDTVFLYPLT
jgi:hypothetical protein